jgi:hypothetical protein
MKATLEFNLDEPVDQAAHMRAVKATDMAVVLWDMDQYLRGLIKYGELDESADKALEEARDKLHQLMSERVVDLDELLKY